MQDLHWNEYTKQKDERNERENGKLRDGRESDNFY